jgi:hypothetical protein
MLAFAPRVQVAFPAGEARVRVAIPAGEARVRVAMQPGTQLRK